MKKMPILSGLIGLFLSSITTCFRIEQGAKLKKILPSAAILAILFSIGVYGFFYGIKGLCPYLGRY